MKVILRLLLIAASLFVQKTYAQQHSVARVWNEALLKAIRGDFARPTAHARNLFHVSAAMYDAWAAYDPEAEPFLLGKTVGNYTCPFVGISTPPSVKAAQEEAISYAAYRITRHRFKTSPGLAVTLPYLDQQMASLGYSISYTSTDYVNGKPAALGNYIAEQYIAFGLQDGSNEAANFANKFYQPVNPPLVVKFPGNPTAKDPNRWQPVTVDVFVDQNGNVIPGTTPPFQTPEWGHVVPFALTTNDRKAYQRNGFIYPVYHDPGAPPYLDTTKVGGLSEEYKWGYALVAAWSGLLDPSDNVKIDISPASQGNNGPLPSSIEGLRSFYDLMEGGDYSEGHSVNPKTGQAYSPQLVSRGDYCRVLAEFWADGPNSETPPGHWFTILNYVHDHPAFQRKFKGKGPELDDLEWDIKAYFMLGGGMHDAAITAWGIKGWYDYTRPVAAIRYMAGKGQSSDPNGMSYHPAGLPLIPGRIEVVKSGDPLDGGITKKNVGKIKIYTWRGPNAIVNPATDVAGAGWILAENWWPYQRPTFVTPPFAGYISGHSTYSRTAAEILTMLTGDAYFPGGMGEFYCKKNEYLVFEDGPSQDIKLQWATYRDASDQCSLSRIYGGIHPPADDIPGRRIGIELAEDAFNHALSYFYKDEDKDGAYSFEDCDDQNPAINPYEPETCDGKDNNCNGINDEGLQVVRCYHDKDNDGFGDFASFVDTCIAHLPNGFVINSLDCDDSNPEIRPGSEEFCDGVDNDCNGKTDDLEKTFVYYRDKDQDGFGSTAIFIDTCAASAPIGYTLDNQDCDDNDANVYPGAPEKCDSKDNDCNGVSDDIGPTYTYYLDQDGDGFGAAALSIDTCAATTPVGYALNNEDCDDNDAFTYPGAPERCDGKDNNCNLSSDEGVKPLYTYYADQDGDGFGSLTVKIETCLSAAPIGYVVNKTDCDDTNGKINPLQREVFDGIDNDCNGKIDEDLVATDEDLAHTLSVYPNPADNEIYITCDCTENIRVSVFRTDGKVAMEQELSYRPQQTILSVAALPAGVYWLRLTDQNGRRQQVVKIAKF